MLYDHALHSICIFTIFHAFSCVFVFETCVLVGLDWVEPMMQLFLARHMFMHISCINTLSFLSLYSFVIVFCHFLFLLDRLHIAPKRKSTLAWNPLGFGSSSDLPTPLLHVQFHDGKAQQDFLENF